MVGMMSVNVVLVLVRDAVGIMVGTSRSRNRSHHHSGAGVGVEEGVGEVVVVGMGREGAARMGEVTIGGCLMVDGAGEEEGGARRLGRLGVGTRRRTGGDHFYASFSFFFLILWRLFFLFSFF
jgi:hypothetical protein